jgi:hypothetical protein
MAVLLELRWKGKITRFAADSWLNRSRRLLTRWEKNVLATLHFPVRLLCKVNSYWNRFLITFSVPLLPSLPSKKYSTAAEVAYYKSVAVLLQ